MAIVLAVAARQASTLAVSPGSLNKPVRPTFSRPERPYPGADGRNGMLTAVPQHSRLLARTGPAAVAVTGCALALWGDPTTPGGPLPVCPTLVARVTRPLPTGARMGR